MRKLTTVLAIVIGAADIVLAAAVVFMNMQGNATKAGASTETAAYESNEDTYYNEENYTESYAGMVIAAREEGMTEPTPTATPEPTPTATPEPTAAPTTDTTAIPDSDFIFPDSDVALITEDQMKASLPDAASWQRAVNEIYARHGYQFHQDKNPTDYAYFNSLAWYQALAKVDSQDAVRASFNSVEKANVDALVAYRNAVGY